MKILKNYDSYKKKLYKKYLYREDPFSINALNPFITSKFDEQEFSFIDYYKFVVSLKYIVANRIIALNDLSKVKSSHIIMILKRTSLSFSEFKKIERIFNKNSFASNKYKQKILNLIGIFLIQNIKIPISLDVIYEILAKVFFLNIVVYDFDDVGLLKKTFRCDTYDAKYTMEIIKKYNNYYFLGLVKELK